MSLFPGCPPATKCRAALCLPAAVLEPFPAAQNLSGIILATPLPCDRGVGETLAPGGDEGRRTMSWKGCRHTSRVECKVAKAGQVPWGWWEGRWGPLECDGEGLVRRMLTEAPENLTSGVHQALPVSSTVRGPNAYRTLIKILHLQGIFNII